MGDSDYQFLQVHIRSGRREFILQDARLRGNASCPCGNGDYARSRGGAASLTGQRLADVEVKPAFPRVGLVIVGETKHRTRRHGIIEENAGIIGNEHVRDKHQLVQRRIVRNVPEKTVRRQTQRAHDLVMRPKQHDVIATERRSHLRTSTGGFATHPFARPSRIPDTSARRESLFCPQEFPAPFSARQCGNAFFIHGF